MNQENLDLTRLFPRVVKGLDARERAALANALEPCVWQPNRLVVAQGTPCDSLYLMIEGELEVWVEHGNRTQWIGRIREGEVLGEVSLLDPGPATATVRGAGVCRALRLRHDRLDELWETHPRVASALHAEAVRGVSKRVRTATASSAEVAP
jgi:CRP-like cAMP-binding protein